MAGCDPHPSGFEIGRAHRCRLHDVREFIHPISYSAPRWIQRGSGPITPLYIREAGDGRQYTTPCRRKLSKIWRSRQSSLSNTFRRCGLVEYVSEAQGFKMFVWQKKKHIRHYTRSCLAVSEGKPANLLWSSAPVVCHLDPSRELLMEIVGDRCGVISSTGLMQVLGGEGLFFATTGSCCKLHQELFQR